MGLQSPTPHRVVPNISPFFVCYGGITKGTGAAVVNRVMLGRAGFKDKMYILSQAGFAPRSHLSQYKGTAAPGLVFRLSQAGGAKQPRD